VIPTPSLPILKSSALSTRRNVEKPIAFLSGFQSLAPRFRASQREHLAWLADAHATLGHAHPERMRALFLHYSGSTDAIAHRAHELPDFTHRDWNTMRLFSPKGSNVQQKNDFFDEAVSRAFQRFYPTRHSAPDALVHVTCTGYSAPSAAQKLVAARRWGRTTQVLHAYHMGCYAAHPALRIAAGHAAFLPKGRGPVDIVHTELCSLHLDPANHDPAQLIIQSLFADGFMRYQLHSARPLTAASLEVVALRDEILPDSSQAMTLTKEVPMRLAEALAGFTDRLFTSAGRNLAREKTKSVFAIHPGGPRIVEASQKALQLTDAQVVWSRRVLRDHGNMSSATLPHIWEAILKDKRVPDGALIVSLGAGPGLTLSGALLRKHTAR
jgi:predicted naringenin-chalcone synthase